LGLGSPPPLCPRSYQKGPQAHPPDIALQIGGTGTLPRERGGGGSGCQKMTVSEETGERNPPPGQSRMLTEPVPLSTPDLMSIPRSPSDPRYSISTPPFPLSCAFRTSISAHSFLSFPSPSPSPHCGRTFPQWPSELPFRCFLPSPLRRSDFIPMPIDPLWTPPHLHF